MKLASLYLLVREAQNLRPLTLKQIRWKLGLLVGIKIELAISL